MNARRLLPLLACLGAALATTPALAERVLDEGTVQIDGQPRH